MRTHIVYRFLFILLSSFIFPCFGQNADKVHEIDKLMTYSHARGFFNGVILVAENRKIIYKKAFGYADIEDGLKLETDHQFYLGSVSKQFTSMAIMILKERGQLDYDDKLLTFFPDYPSYAKDITIRHLLTHTSGIKDYLDHGMYKPGLTNRQAYDFLIRQETLNFNPGDKYKYSNSGYALLAMIVEKVSGQTFKTFLTENIFKPLGLQQTLVYDKSRPKIEKRAIGYNKKAQKDDYNLFTIGAGGMYSTVDDLFKWEQSLYQPSIVKMGTLQQAWKPYKLNNDSLINYGFGWNILNEKENIRYWHTGSLAGFRSYLERDITKKNTIILLTNMGDAFKGDEIYTALRNILDGSKYRLPRDKFLVEEYTNFNRYREDNMAIGPSAENRVVFMGNSITEGWKRLSPGFFENENYINRGISGQVSQQMLLRFRRDVIDLNPRVVVILAGTNDIAQNSGYVPLEDVINNISSMAELADYHGIKVIIGSVPPAIDFPWSPGLKPAPKITRLNDMLKKYITEKGFIFVDYHSALVDESGGLKVPDYTSAADLVHPNARGYQVMEKMLKPAIENALKQK